MGMPSGPELIIIFALIGIFLIPIIMHFNQEKVILKHSLLRKNQEVPFMYSWISLIFGFFVPLLRGDIKWFFIYLLSTIFTSGIGNIILAFFMNKSYLTTLLEKGYEPADERSKQLLVSRNIISEDQPL